MKVYKVRADWLNRYNQTTMVYKGTILYEYKWWEHLPHRDGWILVSERKGGMKCFQIDLDALVPLDKEERDVLYATVDEFKRVFKLPDSYLISRLNIILEGMDGKKYLPPKFLKKMRFFRRFRSPIIIKCLDIIHKYPFDTDIEIDAPKFIALMNGDTSVDPRDPNEKIRIINVDTQKFKQGNLFYLKRQGWADKGNYLEMSMMDFLKATYVHTDHYQ